MGTKEVIIIIENLLEKFDKSEFNEEIMAMEVEKLKTGLSSEEQQLLDITAGHIKNKSVMRKCEQQLLRRIKKMYESARENIPVENLSDESVQVQFMSIVNDLYIKEKEFWEATPLSAYSVKMLISFNDRLWNEYNLKMEKEK